MFRTLTRTSLSISAFALALSFTASAQTPALITLPINENNLVTLAGNTRPEAKPANDLGRVSDDLVMSHMLLQLQRSPEGDAALDEFIQQQTDPKSPNYHQWLTAVQFGSRFGLAQSDLITISGWLQSHGFTVNSVYPTGMLIDFTGTAGQIRTAFHTEIHNLSVNGQAHIANMSDPKIPAALAPAVAGVVSMHNFLPHPMVERKAQYTPGNGEYLVTPQDLATIYNFNPEFSAKITGSGQTIVVVEDTNLYSTADWTSFRTTFGLTRFTGATLTQVHPASSGTNNCSNPGTNGDSIEAAVDVEYATAAAPNAAIELASCADTATFGGLIALNNLLAGTSPPAIVSVSYGECEAVSGASQNAAFKSAYSTAATEGVSIFVASGDTASDSCAQALGLEGEAVTTGTSVSGWASTPYDLAVGGTDFQDFYLNDYSTYWSSTNSTYYGSALSYMPEIPWNNTCASPLFAQYFGLTTTYGSTGSCNVESGFTDPSGGGGGQSACATGAPATSGVTGGTCKGYPKPSWQSVYGNKADGVRDLPDLSLFASNGFLGSAYVFCYSDVRAGGAKCTGAPSGWSLAGGTSFASPIMAGVQALINQKTGARQGLPNPAYYKLAAAEYGTTGSTACNAENGNTVGSTCNFHDITEGGIDLACTGTVDCYLPSGTYGVLSTSDSAYKPTFEAAPGWDFASGLGSVNVANIVNNWSTVAP